MDTRDLGIFKGTDKQFAKQATSYRQRHDDHRSELMPPDTDVDPTGFLLQSHGFSDELSYRIGVRSSCIVWATPRPDGQCDLYVQVVTGQWRDIEQRVVRFIGYLKQSGWLAEPEAKQPQLEGAQLPSEGIRPEGEQKQPTANTQLVQATDAPTAQIDQLKPETVKSERLSATRKAKPITLLTGGLIKWFAETVGSIDDAAIELRLPTSRYYDNSDKVYTADFLLEYGVTFKEVLEKFNELKRNDSLLIKWWGEKMRAKKRVIP